MNLPWDKSNEMQKRAFKVLGDHRKNPGCM